MKLPTRKYPKKKIREELDQKKSGTRREVQNRKQAEAMILAAKSHPCMDCGKVYPTWIMELDHRDPKQKIAAVSKMKYEGLSPLIIQEEILKCDPVCSNCHKEREHQRAQRKPA